MRTLSQHVRRAWLEVCETHHAPRVVPDKLELLVGLEEVLNRPQLGAIHIRLVLGGPAVADGERVTNEQPGARVGQLDCPRHERPGEAPQQLLAVRECVALPSA